jgi:hypothetical protein
MEQRQIEEHLNAAIGNLLTSQPNLFDFTSETNQTEWNIAHHLATEVSKRFPDYDCDLDVCKPNLEHRRPDIIVHRRGTHDHNLLVIEIKRDRANVDGEIEKICTWWFAQRLHYEYGAVVVINEYEEPFVSVISND